MRKRVSVKVSEPYYVNIPKNAVHMGFYGKFDIVSQTRAVSTYSDNPHIIRCAHPFTIKVKVRGKEKELISKREVIKD